VPVYTRGDVTIHYEESGAGYPVLLFAPGLMRSSISRWENSDLKPLEVLATGYRVIAMDQRNAVKSRAPIKATDGWSEYAQDAIGLIDELGLDSLAIWGRCIGPSFCMKVIEQLGSRADRVTAFIDHAPIGLNAINRGHYMHGFYQLHAFDADADARAARTRSGAPGGDRSGNGAAGPNAELKLDWQQDLPAATSAVRSFLQAHTRGTGRRQAFEIVG
jgi:pimeloyl-ACP methyl ester carboxylesterase